MMWLGSVVKAILEFLSGFRKAPDVAKDSTPPPRPDRERVGEWVRRRVKDRTGAADDVDRRDTD